MLSSSCNSSALQHESTDSGEQPEDHVVMMFDICRTEDGKASVGRFLDEINRTGIRKTDPRMAQMMKSLDKLKPPSLPSVEELKLDLQAFKYVVSENVVLITKALQNQMIIPAFDAFCDNITKIYHNCKNNSSGRPADYIPQLAEFGHDEWGVSICTVDGQRFSLGDANTPFTIQATSTPLTYAITLNELGNDVVHRYQGRKPSGRMFNEILLDFNNKPHNPMVAGGAIMSAALIISLVRPDLKCMATKFEFIHEFIKDMAGGERVSFNNSVFLAERSVADRHYALAYFMRENGCFPVDIDIRKALDFHFQICSLETTCESNSVIAATLANGGVCPITGQRVLDSSAVQNVLSLMYCCGMYNYSGQFAFSVGLPGKSGRSGALMVIIPNVMGITLWSPPLDNLGNTVRGIQFCKELVGLYKFHRFDGVGMHTLLNKVNPIFQKYESASHIVIQILLASKDGDLRSLKQFWLQDIDLNVSDYDGRTALHLSAAEGHIDCVKFLLEICKVNPSPMDRWERTPMKEAITFEKASVASYLKEFIDSNRYQGELFTDYGFEFEADDEAAEEENESEVQEPPAFLDYMPPNDGKPKDATSLFLNRFIRADTESASDDDANSELNQQRTSRRDFLDPNMIQPNVARGDRRRSTSSLGNHNLNLRVNTRSPRISPGGSPTLPRANFKFQSSDLLSNTNFN